MQSLTWYARRLRTMSAPEVLWRARTALRDVADRYLVSGRARPRPVAAILRDGSNDGTPGFRVTDVEVGEWPSRRAIGHRQDTRLLEQADRIAAHRLSFFDLEDQHLGDPIDWNRDHKSGKPAPLTFSPSIDYRDFDVTGDCKFVWEPNRHHQLVVLGRAYRASGDVRYAAAVVEQLDSWLRQCPFGVGMNWRSPLELGIRLINWVWAFDLIRESGVFEGEIRSRFLDAVHRHVWEIARKYSRGSSSNNHLIGEAAGVFIATSYFRGLDDASGWQAQSREILCEQMAAQTYPDGGTREQALGYHLFVLQLFLLAGMVARRTGVELSPAYWSRLEKMFEFVGALSEGGRRLPMFGDCDEGYVLDLGGAPGDAGALLSIGAALYERADFKAWAGGYAEPARWLLDRECAGRFDALEEARGENRIASRAFPESGYYLLQCGRREAADRISVVFDCGELGYGTLAAHGHADALSFTLRAFGVEVLVDPGTYDYFSFPRWRDYFRSTRAHNTVVVDGRDQSEMLGSFLWGARAKARCVCWEPTGNGGRVVGEHDGYARLGDPAVHRRTLELDGRGRRLTVRDEIRARGNHEVAIHFHLAETCRMARTDGNRFTVDAGPGQVTIQLDPCLSVVALTGSRDPVGGWVSRGYHRKAPSTTLVGRWCASGALGLVTQIDISGLLEPPTDGGSTRNT